MKTFKRIVALFLALTLAFSLLPTWAAAADDDVTQVSNSYILVSVNNKNGRFAVRTVNGQPIRKNDDNSILTFNGDDTSFTTIRVDGSDYIFGNSYSLKEERDGETYKITSKLSDSTVTESEDGTYIATRWVLNFSGIRSEKFEDYLTGEYIEVIQSMKVSADADLENAGAVNIRYDISNMTEKDVKIGSRLLLDTMIGNNDGPAYQNGSTQENLQQTERTFVRNLSNGEKVDGVTIDNTNYNYYKLSGYFMMRDAGDYTDPLSTNIYAYGLNSVAIGSDVGIKTEAYTCDKVIVGHWAHLANSKYDVTVDPHLNFTTDTNDYGTADSAVAYYYDPHTVKSGEGMAFSIAYGVGEIIEENKTLNVSFIDQQSQLQTNDAETAYLNDGVFQIIVQVQCPEDSKLTHSYITCELTVDSQLSFVNTLNDVPQYDEWGNVDIIAGNVQKKTYTKTITDLSAGGTAFGPGDICTFRFTLQGEGKAWPSTPSYVVKVSSPEIEEAVSASLRNESETEDSYAGDQVMEDEISSITLNEFIMLPALGNMTATSCYAFTPEAAYFPDEKLISVGINNFGAYNIGDSANFHLYLVNIMSGERYEANVTRDAILVASDGENGVIKLNYNGGVEVDEYGDPKNSPGVPMSVQLENATDPTLPVGYYSVQVSFNKSDGMTDEEVAMLSFTTDQCFEVSSDPATGLLHGSYLAVSRRYVELTDEEYARYKNYIDKLNEVSDKFADDGVQYYMSDNHYFPYYEYKVLESLTDVWDYRKEINALGEDGNPIEHYKDWATDTDWTNGELILFIRGEVKVQDGNLVIETPASGKTSINGVVMTTGKITLQTGNLSDLLKKEWREYMGYETLTESVEGEANFTTLTQENFNAISFDVFGENILYSMSYIRLVSEKGSYVLTTGNTLTKSKWSLDFFNGFSKSLSLQYEEEQKNVGAVDASNPYSFFQMTAFDNCVNYYANGEINEQANPLHILAQSDVYFNQLDVTAGIDCSAKIVDLSLDSFHLSYQDGDYTVSLSGEAKLVFFYGDINEVSYNTKGFYGIDCRVGFSLLDGIGLLVSSVPAVGDSLSKIVDFICRDDKKQGRANAKLIEAAATLAVSFYPGSESHTNYIGIGCEFAIPLIGTLACGIGFKEAGAEWLMLVDSVAFKYGKASKSSSKEAAAADAAAEAVSSTAEEAEETITGGLLPIWPYPLILVNGIRGGIFNLVGCGVDDVQMSLTAGLTVSIYTGPANFRAQGDVYLNAGSSETVSGVTMGIEASLDYMLGPIPIALITYACIEFSAGDPSYIAITGQFDLLGLGMVVGEGTIFVGKVTDKNGNLNEDVIERFNLQVEEDYDWDCYLQGYISANIKMPDAIGGMKFAGITVGISSEKFQAGIAFALMEVEMRYYWGGDEDQGLEFTTYTFWSDTEKYGDKCYYYLLNIDEETGAQSVIGLGSNMKTVATSRVDDGGDGDEQDVIYRDLEGGLQLIEFRSNEVGVGGITTSNFNMTHEIPLRELVFDDTYNSANNAIIKVQYYEEEEPVIELTDKNGTFLNYTTITSADAENANDTDTIYKYSYTCEEDSVTNRYMYIMVPYELLTEIDTMTINSDQSIDTVLIQNTKLSKLGDVELDTEKNGSKTSATITAEAEYVKAGDKIWYYLTENKMDFDSGDSGDLGLPIATYTLTEDDFNPDRKLEMAQNVELTQAYADLDGDGEVEETGTWTGVQNGKAVVRIDDISKCYMMGDVYNLNELLESGNYYVTVKLESSAPALKQTEDSITLEDKKAPNALKDVTVNRGGDGNLSVNFKFDDSADDVINDSDGVTLSFYTDLTDEDGNTTATRKEYSNKTFMNENANYKETGYKNLAYTDIYVDKSSMTLNEDGSYTVKLGKRSESTSEEDTDEDGEADFEYTVYRGLETERLYYVEACATYREELQTESSGSGTDTVERSHNSKPVAATVKASSKYADKGENSERIYLPPYTPAELEVVGAEEVSDEDSLFNCYDVLSNTEIPVIKLKSDVDTDVDMYFSGELKQSVHLNANEITEVALEFMKDYDTEMDVQLKFTSCETLDTNSVYLYIRKDTTPPTLFISSPTSGDIVDNGVVNYDGRTDGGGDVKVTVYVGDSETGTELNVSEDGVISGSVKIPVNESAVKLTLVAVDGAGNTTKSYCTVVNGEYEIVHSIVIRSLAETAVGESAKLETVARIAGEKDENGVVQYTEKKLDNSDVTYTITKGSSAVVDGDEVTVINSGASILQAVYTTNDGRELETTTVVRTASESIDDNDKSDDKTDSGKTDSGKTDSGTTDSGKTDSGTTVIPGGVVSGGDTESDTEELSAENSKTTVNKNAVAVNKDASKVVSIDASGESGEVNIISKLDAEGFEISYKAGSSLDISTEMFKADLPADVLGKSGTVSVVSTDDTKGSKGDTVMAMSVNLGDAGNLKQPVTLSVAVPDDVALDDVTAVLLRDKDGNVTPVSFKLNMIGNKAYYDVLLLDEGTLIFEKCENRFDDVAADSWAYEDINAAAAREVIVGVGGNSFAPKSDITRSAFATIVLRTGGLLTRDSATKLKDVKTGNWDYSALAISKDIGVMTGDENGNMNGSSKVTRVQAMAMVGRFLKYMGVSDTLTDDDIDEQLKVFGDYSTLPNWAKADVALCVKYGVILGSNGYLLPNDNLTREQCAAIANRMNSVITGLY